MTKPEQPAFDATNNLLYVTDASSKSVGVVRFHFDPATETLNTPEVVAAGLSGTGNGLDGQRADAVALDQTSGNLYVGFRARNLGAATQIARVNNPSAPDTTTQTVDFVARPHGASRCSGWASSSTRPPAPSRRRPTSTSGTTRVSTC
jgi:hypothetical protein